MLELEIEYRGRTLLHTPDFLVRKHKHLSACNVLLFGQWLKKRLSSLKLHPAPSSLMSKKNVRNFEDWVKYLTLQNPFFSIAWIFQSGSRRYQLHSESWKKASGIHQLLAWTVCSSFAFIFSWNASSLSFVSTAAMLKRAYLRILSSWTVLLIISIMFSDKDLLMWRESKCPVHICVVSLPLCLINPQSLRINLEN